MPLLREKEILGCSAERHPKTMVGHYCLNNDHAACVVAWKFIATTFSWFGIALLILTVAAVGWTIAERRRGRIGKFFHLHRENAVRQWFVRRWYAQIILVRRYCSLKCPLLISCLFAALDTENRRRSVPMSAVVYAVHSTVQFSLRGEYAVVSLGDLTVNSCTYCFAVVDSPIVDCGNGVHRPVFRARLHSVVLLTPPVRQLMCCSISVE